ncbi:hypothetical protein [Halosimplex salinum]|uniref:hypothetical protein n=1 Tax=Halosimplex salinum TaxID=1710538 RepID=UPI0013DD8D19|nr:hypothetical protein [Halosimplex salinum]
MPSLPTGVLSSTAAKAVVVVAFVAVGGVAAAQIGVIDGMMSSEDAEALDQVPDGVDSVAAIDGSILEEDVSERLYATAYNATVRQELEAEESEENETEMRRSSPAEMVPANLTAALDEAENESGLDPRAVDEVVVFSQERNFSQQDYAGAVVHADWNESAVVAAASNSSDSEYENTTVEGVTVYKPVENETEEDEMTFGAPDPEEWIAVLDDGQYAFGTDEAVNDTIQVEVGNADPVDGDLRTAFEETRDGYVRYAQRSQNVNVTRINQTMGQRTGLNVTAYAQAYNDLHVTAGSYYLTEDSLGFESRTLTNSTDTARDVEDLTQGFISIQAGAIQNETIENELRSAEVTRDGTTVTVTRETSVETAEKLLRWFGSAVNEEQTGDSGAEPVA